MLIIDWLLLYLANKFCGGRTKLIKRQTTRELGYEVLQCDSESFLFNCIRHVATGVRQ